MTLPFPVFTGKPIPGPRNAFPVIPRAGLGTTLVYLSSSSAPSAPALPDHLGVLQNSHRTETPGKISEHRGAAANGLSGLPARTKFSLLSHLTLPFAPLCLRPQRFRVTPCAVLPVQVNHIAHSCVSQEVT